MIVGFTTTYAISAYHHWCFEFESRWGQDVWSSSVTCVWWPNHEVDMIMTGVMLHNITISIWLVNFMVFNATFNDISVISWRSALLVKKTLVPRENPPNASHWTCKEGWGVCFPPSQKTVLTRNKNLIISVICECCQDFIIESRVRLCMYFFLYLSGQYFFLCNI
jgi:hypothetical protein